MTVHAGVGVVDVVVTLDEEREDRPCRALGVETAHGVIVTDGLSTRPCPRPRPSLTVGPARRDPHQTCGDAMGSTKTYRGSR